MNPCAVEILDYAHAKEHLYDLAKELYGEGTSKTQTWAEEKETLLYDGKIEQPLTSLRRTKVKTLEGREKLKSTITYYEHNRRRMKYDEYRAKGYHIGSGIAEAACKQLVGQRLKQSGMRWSRQGAEAMLQLKILRVNRRWDVLQELQKQETAAYLRLSQMTVLRLAQKGFLPGTKFGRQWRFSADGIAGLLRHPEILRHVDLRR